MNQYLIALVIVGGVFFSMSDLLAQNSTCEALKDFKLGPYKSAEKLLKSCASQQVNKISLRSKSIKINRAQEGESGGRITSVPSKLNLRKKSIQLSYGSPRPKAIYIKDYRKEGYEILISNNPKNSRLRQTIRATALLIHRIEDGQRMIYQRQGKYILKTEPYRVPIGKPWNQSFPLCKGERFAEQKTAGICSGFLVGEKYLVTAGHCVNYEDGNINDPDKSKVVVVFGFYQENNKERRIFDSDKVYGVREVVKRTDNHNLKPPRDYAIIELDRPVPNSIAEPLKLASNKEGPDIEVGMAVGVSGHPNGLTNKVTYDRKSVITTLGDKTTFTAQIDTFGGNSGSPVFFYDHPNIVAGILIKGNNDYSLDAEKQCLKNEIYEGSNEGELITKSSVFIDFIP